MKMRVQHAVLVLFIFMFGSCSTEPIDDTPNIAATNLVGLEQEVLDIVNSHRFEYRDKHFNI
jgi:hypothetical protein